MQRHDSTHFTERPSLAVSSETTLAPPRSLLFPTRTLYVYPQSFVSFTCWIHSSSLLKDCQLSTEKTNTIHWILCKQTLDTMYWSLTKQVSQNKICRVWSRPWSVETWTVFLWELILSDLCLVFFWGFPSIKALMIDVLPVFCYPQTAIFVCHILSGSEG